MNRFFAATATLPLLLSAWLVAAAQARLTFEVVAIKPAPRPTPQAIQAGTARLAFNIDGARVEIVGYRLAALLAKAFQVEPQQVDAGRFAGSETFEIQAKLPAGATREQIPEMLQTMLAERFKLAYHRETRVYQVTVVTVGKRGIKLPRLPDGTQEASTSTRLSNGATRFTQTGTVASLFPVMNSFGGFSHMVDETGLDGIYTWVRELPPLAPDVTYREATQDSIRLMIETAGLKLEARKIPKETVVVDYLESMPTEN
jgi:uncharacterized protein (TIGR03435 family)